MTEEKQPFTEPIYKQWFKTKTQSGFLSVTPFERANKFSIEIGETSAEGSSAELLGATSTFVDYNTLGAYLRCIVANTERANFSERAKRGSEWVSRPGVLAIHGGGVVDGKAVARIFKSTPHESIEGRYVWHCVHMSARETSSGAFIPESNAVLSQNSIQITRQDLTVLSYIVDRYLFKRD